MKKTISVFISLALLLSAAFAFGVIGTAKNNTIEMRRILALLVKTGFYGNHNDTAKTVEKWVRDANK
jgi:hypothetical protein